MKKITKPKINDYVEMIDMSKMFGLVKTIISNNELEIEWSDKIKTYKTIERTKNIALVDRN